MGSVNRRERALRRRGITRTIERLETFARNRRFSPVEVERFSHDLTLAQRRLVTREYAQSSYQPRSLLRIPDRTEELFTDLTFYWSVGRVWREVLEKVIPPTVQHAAELGCGYVPKASLGLHYLNYMGRVDLVDSDEAAASHARNFLELFGARFHCDTRRTTLIEAPQEAYDLVVANHLLDDLALSFYCATQGSEFTALYLDEVSYASTWRTMVADREWLPGFVDSTVSTLLRLLKPNGTVVLIDYPSFSHRALGLTTLIQFVRDAQFLLREKFMEKGARVVSDPIVKPVVCDRLRVTHEDLIVVQREVPG